MKAMTVAALIAISAVSAAVAQKSAEIVSNAIVTTPMQSLENHAIGDIQTWRDSDEAIAQQLRGSLTTANPIPAGLTGFFAAHLVAAATISALTQGANIPLIFSRMIDLLKSLNDKNPAFGPLRVRHPGNMVRDRAYIPHAEVRAASAAIAGKGKE